MKKDQTHSGLKQKVLLLLSSACLVVYSVFSYYTFYAYQENFNHAQEIISKHHVGLLDQLVADSFASLEKLTLIIPAFNQSNPTNKLLAVNNFIDTNWRAWQLDQIALYDQQGNTTGLWGHKINQLNQIPGHLLSNQKIQRVVCNQAECFQQIITPLDRQANQFVGLTRSFAGIVKSYEKVANSRALLLITVNDVGGKINWPSILTNVKSDDPIRAIYQHITNHYPAKHLLNTCQRINFHHQAFNVNLLPLSQTVVTNNTGYFLLVDEVTSNQQQLGRRWLFLQGFTLLGLVGLILLVSKILDYWLDRIVWLSNTMPLLVDNQLQQFKNQIEGKQNNKRLDELDCLYDISLQLVGRLIQDEHAVHRAHCELMEKSQLLAKERDFLLQLVDVAPIIILTQRLNGIILSINQAGVNSFENNKLDIIGKVFEVFLPETDREHLKCLNELRLGQKGGDCQISGSLVTISGKQKEISWIHTVVKTNGQPDDSVILTLGIDVNETKINQEKIFKLLTYDPVTGFGNRKKFDEDFAMELACAKRYGYQVALFYLDLDKFKVVNDLEGRDAGDKCLSHIATLLKEMLRQTDSIARVGDDEFAIVVPYANLSGIDNIAQKINHVLSGYKLTIASKDYQLTASVGISVFPLHGLVAHDLVRNADHAMYQAKAAGYGHYRIFKPDVAYREKLDLLLHWRETLEYAIAQDRFILFYQPILDLRTDKINHYECLIRMQQDDGRLVMPVDFIPYAEELGLVGHIDRLVLKKVIQKHMELRQQGKDYKLTINLSGRLFSDVTIVDNISWLIKDRDVDPGSIIFEIAETAIVANFAAADRLIAQINELGCLIAFDNFGVGFSSVYYLNRFPIAYVKIDGSFICNLDKNDDDKVFVKALSGVAQAYGKKTVAESVENIQALIILRELGIDFAQGYYIGGPGPLD